MALHSFQTTKGGFPPGRWTLPKGSKVNVHWIPYIFPYIDQQALFDRYDFNVSFKAPENDKGVNQTNIGLLQCLSAPAGRRSKRKRAITDYAGTASIHRPNPFLDPMPKHDRTFVGVMGHNVYRKISDILDGTSNTLLVAEDAGLDQQWAMGRMLEPTGPGLGAWASSSNLLNIAGFNPVSMSTPGPCAVNCYNRTEIYSFHPGGANVLFADGSVRFLFEKVDINIVAALFTRKGGETIAPGSYGE